MSSANDTPNLHTVVLGSGISIVPNDCFSGNPITSITIGANVTIQPAQSYPHTMGDHGDSFVTAYENTYSKAAGTYTWNGSVWTKTA